jgi:hypothetical protein
VSRAPRGQKGRCVITTPAKTDYLAIIPIGGGSSWGRDPDKETAINHAIRNFKDWEVYYDVSNIEVTINVIDVQGYDECAWGGYPGGYIHGTNEATGEDEAIKRPIEHVKRTTPKWKHRKR